MSSLPPSFALNTSTNKLSLSPRDQTFVQDPYPAYAALHADASDDGPIVYWKDYGHWVFGGLEAVNVLFRDRRLGRQILHKTTREALGWPPQPSHLSDFYAVDAHSLLELEPPDHTRLRGLITRAFVSRQIETMAPSIEGRARHLLAALRGQDQADLIKDFSEPLAVTMIADMLGIERSFGPQLLDWSHKMVRIYQAECTTEDEHAANAAARDFADWVRLQVKERRTNLGDDLLSHLVTVNDSTDRLSEDEIISTVILLLNAGHEATVHAMGHALYGLLNASEDQRQSWLADPASLTEEVLRHRPPLHMFTRYVLENCTLYGQDFRLGDVIGLHLGMANHDPRATPSPHVFDPSRTPIKNVAFGAGIHFCIGHALARLELETALPVVFEAYPNLALVEQPLLKDAYHFHGFEALKVQLA